MTIAISLVFGMLLAWLAAIAVLIVLLIYRALLSGREEDQLFIDPGEVRLAREQREIVKKLERLSPYLWTFFILVILLGVGTFGLWVYQQLR